MPTYDYICKSCGHVFEEFQKITDEPLKFCPKCSGPVVRKIGAGAGIQFKGSGFYITDYKKSPEKSKSSSPETKTQKKKAS